MIVSKLVGLRVCNQMTFRSFCTNKEKYSSFEKYPDCIALEISELREITIFNHKIIEHYKILPIKKTTTTKLNSIKTNI